MHHRAQVHRAQQVPHPRGVVVGPLAEHEHLGMVVDREGLVCGLVVDAPRPDGGVRLEHGHQLEPQAPLEHAHLGPVVAGLDGLGGRAAHQVAVISRDQGEAFGQAGQAAPLAAGSDEHDIGLVQQVVETLAFFLVVVPIHLQRGQAGVQSAEGVIAVHPQRQAVVPGGLVEHPGAFQRHRPPVHRQGQGVDGLRVYGQGRVQRQAQRLGQGRSRVVGDERGSGRGLGLPRGIFHGHGQRALRGVGGGAQAVEQHGLHPARVSGPPGGLPGRVGREQMVRGVGHGLPHHAAVVGADFDGKRGREGVEKPAAGRDAGVGAGVDAGEPPGPGRGGQPHPRGRHQQHAPPRRPPGAAHGPVPDPGRQHRQGRVRGQEVAHGGVPQGRLPGQVARGPHHQQRIAAEGAPGHPQGQPHQPGQRAQAQGPAQAPAHQIGQAIPPRPAGPLHRRREVGLAAGLHFQGLQVGNPVGVGQDVPDMGPAERVGLPHPKGDEGHGRGQQQAVEGFLQPRGPVRPRRARHPQPVGQHQQPGRGRGADLGGHGQAHGQAEQGVVGPGGAVPGAGLHPQGHGQRGEGEEGDIIVEGQVMGLLDGHHGQRVGGRGQQPRPAAVEPAAHRVHQQHRAHIHQGREGPAQHIERRRGGLHRVPHLIDRADEEQGQGAVDEEAKAPVFGVEGRGRGVEILAPGGGELDAVQHAAQEAFVGVQAGVGRVPIAAHAAQAVGRDQHQQQGQGPRVAAGPRGGRGGGGLGGKRAAVHHRASPPGKGR